jgi:hypothetical protein
MTPQSPVVEGLEPYEILLGADQPQYLPLPVLRSPAPQYAVMSRWVPTAEERKLIAEGADIYLTLFTFGADYPPTQIHIMRSSADAELIEQQMNLNVELSQRMRAQMAAQALKEQTTHEKSN